MKIRSLISIFLGHASKLELPPQPRTVRSTKDGAMMPRKTDPIVFWHLRLLNFLARVVGGGFVLVGIGLPLGAVLMGAVHIMEIVAGLFFLVTGILFFRMKKITLADMEKYFGRRE
jgi:hypothetical protein